MTVRAALELHMRERYTYVPPKLYTLHIRNQILRQHIQADGGSLIVVSADADGVTRRRQSAASGLCPNGVVTATRHPRPSFEGAACRRRRAQLGSGTGRAVRARVRARLGPRTPHGPCQSGDRSRRGLARPPRLRSAAAWMRGAAPERGAGGLVRGSHRLQPHRRGGRLPTPTSGDGTASQSCVTRIRSSQ